MDYLSSYASLLEQSRLYYPSAIRTSLQDHARNPAATTATVVTDNPAASFTPFMGFGLLNGLTVRADREIPLDLSIKTVRQTPDSTAVDEDAVNDTRRNNARNAAKGHYSYGSSGGGGKTETTVVPQATRDPSFMPLTRPIFQHDPSSLPSIINGTPSTVSGVHGALLSSLSIDPSPYLTPFHHSGVCGGVGGFCLDPQRCRMAAAATAASLAAAATATSSSSQRTHHPFMTSLPYSSLASLYERHLTKLIPGNDTTTTTTSSGIQGNSHLPPKTASKSSLDASSTSPSSSSKQHVTMTTASPQHSLPIGTDRYHPYPLSLPMYHHPHHLQSKESPQSCSCCLSKPFPVSCVCCLPATRGYEATPQLLTCYHSPLPASIPNTTASVCGKLVEDGQLSSKKEKPGHHNHHHRHHSSPKNLDKPHPPHSSSKKESEVPSSKRQPPSSNLPSNKIGSEGARWIPQQSKDDGKNVKSSSVDFSVGGKAAKVFAPLAHIPPSPPPSLSTSQPQPPPPPPHRNKKVTTDDTGRRSSIVDGHLSPSHPYYHFYYPQGTPSKKDKPEPFSKLIHHQHHPTKRSSKTSPKPSVLSPMPTFGNHWTAMSKNVKLEIKDATKWDIKEEQFRKMGVAPISLKKEPMSRELTSLSPIGITSSLVEYKAATVTTEALPLCRTTSFEAKPVKDLVVKSGQTGGHWSVTNHNSLIISKEENSDVNVPNERHPKSVKRKHGESSGSNSGFASSSFSNGVTNDGKCDRIKKQPSLRDYKRITEPRMFSKDSRTSGTEVQPIGVTLVRSADSADNQYKSKVLHRTVGSTNKGLTPMPATASVRSSSMLCRIYGEQIQQWLQGADCTGPITSSDFGGERSKMRLSTQSNFDDGISRLRDPVDVANVNSCNTRLLYYEDGDGDDEREEEEEDEDGRRLQVGSDGVKSRTTVRSKKKRMQKCSEESKEESKDTTAVVVAPPSHRGVENNTKRLMINKALGETALHRAARLGYNEVVAYCLEAETVPVDVRDNAGYTPLHECCSRGHLEIARKLLQHGADVNSNAVGGACPIHDAVENDHVEVVRLLLSYGADPLLATYAGSTPLLLSRSWTMSEFLKGFLSDVSGEKNGIVLPWQFHGSAACLDSWPSGYDPLGDLPSDEDEQTSTKNIVEAEFADQSESGALLFEVSDKPHITTYRVPSLRGKGSGFCLLNDVLRHTGMARNDFLACYPDIQVEVVSRQQFVERAESVQLMVDVKASLSAMPSSITFLELVQWDDFLREILDIERVIIPS